MLHFEAEVELARTELGRDRMNTGGGALIKMFGHHAFHPYLLAGGRGGMRHLAIGVDVRRGMRRVDGTGMDTSTLRTTTPTPEAAEREHYTRGSVMALVYF